MERAGGIRIKPIAAAHEQLELDESGNHRYVGYLIRINGVTVYHSGDSTIYPGMTELLSKEGIDLGMLPINGRDAFRTAKGIIGNMNIQEAAELAYTARMDTVIPLHYDMFKGNQERPGGFVDYMYEQFPMQKAHVLARGERFVYVTPNMFLS
ncbi:MBL fold metallo-hydrolase [Paenibacillus hexagrammi]|uniref:MBL fold metallo-hydrolase n=1 Tax=Paenibacillus hexagrammi TaxID=2908839 RepID=UPI0021A7A17F|nr:MBL fold metallo-hydrolase [Paenibacillus sp. YPD9-1]